MINLSQSRCDVYTLHTLSEIIVVIHRAKIRSFVSDVINVCFLFIIFNLVNTEKIFFFATLILMQMRMHITDF